MDTDPLDIDSQICFAVYSAAHAFNRAYRPLLKALGLTYPQYLVMLVLWRADGALTVGEVGQTLMLDGGTVTPLLKRLEAQGLVERSRHDGDERVVCISLTQKGKALRQKALAVPPAIGKATGTTQSEREALRESLARMRDALDAAQPVF